MLNFDYHDSSMVIEINYYDNITTKGLISQCIILHVSQLHNVIEQQRGIERYIVYH